LKFLDSGSGKQEITGRIKRIGSYFRHQRGSGTTKGQHIGSLYVPLKGPQHALTRQESKATANRATAGTGGVPSFFGAQADGQAAPIPAIRWPLDQTGNQTFSDVQSGAG
jgi:hypothetical protein